MNARQRFLCAINNEKTDRLPCQVHCWMPFYLNTYLDGCDQFEAYERTGIDMVIYTSPGYEFAPNDVANWRVERKDLGSDDSGVSHWTETIQTPKGILTQSGSFNQITGWLTEPLVKNGDDLELFLKYCPVPIKADATRMQAEKERLGDRGIMRGSFYCTGQPGVWQSFCYLLGTEAAIFAAVDKPDWVHHALAGIQERHLKAAKLLKDVPFDLIENGGGAGSNTVISPKMFRELCLPYDAAVHQALHDMGFKVVYHLCGGLMKMLEMVAESDADGLETMTPPGMGGDCDLAQCTERVGDKLFFIGGFDQSKGFERGTPEKVRRMVHELHAACPDGGYICCPSDHFFHGDPENLKAFARAARECVY